MRKEAPPPWSVRLGSDAPGIETLPQTMRDFGFAMGVNGYLLGPDGSLHATDHQSLQQDAKHLLEVFRGAPNFTSLSSSTDTVARTLEQTPVLDVVRRYREIDEGEAGRISFLLGGLVRSLKSLNRSDTDIANAVAYVANMAKLGERKSGEAIIAAMAMNVLSGGSLEEDPDFKGHVYRMAEAITEDPITSWETADLGMSQALRLWAFVRNGQNQQVSLAHVMEDYQHMLAFSLPTVGAEFHVPPTDFMSGTFWQRVAMLNMTQYQSGSYIPFSKTEEGLIEIRMNPSIYPVATATWNLMQELLPELKRSYFTMTINKRDTDFSRGHDEHVTTLLHALGNLRYAAFFPRVPSVATPIQVNFGDRYLGQTVRVTCGEFTLTGNWGGQHGSAGQLNICSGYGDLFEGLAFYLSMGLVQPELLDRRILGYDLRKAESLKDATKFKEKDIWNIFTALNRSIVHSPRLNRALELGERIKKELKP